MRQFIELSAKELGITLVFEGSGVNERAVVSSVDGSRAPAVRPGDVLVQVDPRYFRPAEVETLLGDPAKAKDELGWVPQISLQEMVREMVDNDWSLAAQQVVLRANGYRVNSSKE